MDDDDLDNLEYSAKALEVAIKYSFSVAFCYNLLLKFSLQSVIGWVRILKLLVYLTLVEAIIAPHA
jgi:hypothetical protein